MTDRPNRAAAASAAASASRQPRSGAPRVSCCGVSPAGARPSIRTPTSRTGSPGASAVPQRPGGVEHLPGGVGGHGERAGAADRPEVGETDFERHGTAHLPGRPQPGAGLVGEREQGPPDLVRVAHVGVERDLRADRLLHVFRRRPRAGRAPRPARAGGRRTPRPRPGAAGRPAPRRGRVRCAGRAGAARQRSAPPRPTGRTPAAGAGTPAPGRPGPRAGRRAWPGWSRAWPRTCSAPRPTEQVSRCSSATRRRISRGDGGGPARTAGGRRPRRGTPRPARAARPAA